MKVLLQSLAALASLTLLAGNQAMADSIEEKAALCAACHGENGVPVDPKFPIIWGQHAGYIYIQLRDMKSAARKNDVMAPIVAEMSKDDMLAFAEYFEAKDWPSTGYTFAGTAAEDTKANDIEVAAQCTACHQSGYVGNGVIPRLAGQNVDYLVKTTHDFKTKDRANNSFMNDMLATFSSEDIALMSRFVAGHQPN